MLINIYHHKHINKNHKQTSFDPTEITFETIEFYLQKISTLKTNQLCKKNQP